MQTLRGEEKEEQQRGLEAGVRYYCPLSINPVTEHEGGRKTEKERMKLVKNNRDTLRMRKLQLQIRKRFLRKVKLGNRPRKEEQGHLLH